MPEEKASLLEWLGASLGGAYWTLGLGFLGWQTVSVPMRKGILEPLDRAFTATYRYGNATVSQVGTLYQRGIISLKDFIIYLRNLGYDDTAIAIITHYYTLRVYDDIADALIDKLKEEREIYEEALYLKFTGKKLPEKKMLYRWWEIMEAKKLSGEELAKRIRDIDAKIRELKYGLSVEWERLKRDLPEIKIEWYGIKEFLKKKPEEIPAIKVPVKVPVPEAPPAAPPKPKPPKKLYPTRYEWKEGTKKLVKILNELIARGLLPKPFFKHLYNYIVTHRRSGSRFKCGKIRGEFIEDRWVIWIEEER